MSYLSRKPSNAPNKLRPLNPCKSAGPVYTHK